MLTEGEVAEKESTSEEPEDKDFWEGVTKPANTEPSTPDTEVQPVWKQPCCKQYIFIMRFGNLPYFTTVLQSPQEPQDNQSHENDSKAII